MLLVMLLDLFAEGPELLLEVVFQHSPQQVLHACQLWMCSMAYVLLQNPPRWIVYHELVLTSKEYARTVTEIRPDWLLEIAPHMYSSKDIAADLNKKMPKTQGRAAMDA